MEKKKKNNFRKRTHKSLFNTHLSEILPGNIDLTTRTFNFSPTSSTSLIDGTRARVMFEICSNPLQSKLVSKVKSLSR